MKDRMILGRAGDVRDLTADIGADPYATDRIFAALDWESDRKAEGGRIGAALRRLNTADRAFARAVLNGKTWVEIGCPKRTFYWRLKKLEDFFRLEKQGGNALLR